jgi:hypothetical protein
MVDVLVELGAVPYVKTNVPPALYLGETYNYVSVWSDRVGSPASVRLFLSATSASVRRHAFVS